MSKQSADEGTFLGIKDFIAGAVLFLLLTVLLKALMDKGLPGLLSDDALKQVQASGLMFIAFWSVVGNSVFKPFIEVAIERETATVGSESEAMAYKKENRILDEEIEVLLQEHRVVLLNERDNRLAEARRVASSVQSGLEDQLAIRLSTSKEQINGLRRSAELTIEDEASKLASLMIERALSSEGESLLH